MISLVKLIKKSYHVVLGSIALIYFIFTTTTSYILYSTLIKNALTVASFGNAFLRKTAVDIENKATVSKDIFKDVEQKFKKDILKNTKEIENYIRIKYLEKYDVAIISEHGIILETTNLHEKNLNLSQFPDAKKSFDEAKKTLELLIDYPVINSDFKNFFIYLLKYIPEKKVYLQLGYRIMIFSEMIASLAMMDLKSSYHFDYSVYYVYLEKDFMSLLLYGRHEKIDPKMVKDILDKPNKTLLLRSFNDIKLFTMIGQNKGFSIIYILHIKPLSKTFMIGWITLNSILFLLFFILYKKFIHKISKNIEIPLKEMREQLNESKPYQYTGNIVELNDLAKTYEYHLERTKTRDFLKEVLKAQEQERERIATDVHDIVIQNLNYILLKLKQQNDIEFGKILKEQIQALKNMVIDSDILMFKNLGLEKYFEILVSDYSRKFPQFQFYLKNEFNFFDKFEKYEQINILRIVRELVNNAIKHSKGTIIEIRFYKKDNNLNIEVLDNGIGFEPSKIDNHKKFGINSIRERTFILGGKIFINSSKNGTNVLIEIPLNN